MKVFTVSVVDTLNVYTLSYVYTKKEQAIECAKYWRDEILGQISFSKEARVPSRSLLVKAHFARQIESIERTVSIYVFERTIDSGSKDKGTFYEEK